jgi:superoxide dismutase, Cu-Zn family
MNRVNVCATLVTGLLSVCCAHEDNREPRTPKPMTADGSGPSYNGPGTPWQDPDPHAAAAQAPGGMEQSDRRAAAAFIAAPGYKLSGSVTFAEIREGVKVHVEVAGAPPGKKGIHIHQTSDCSDIPNKSMGSHFSPEGHAHGLPTADKHHLGDLGNIEIKENGTGELDIIVKDANLKQQDGYSFITRSVVIHEADDKGTGEAGDAGKPIACGPITN